MTTWQARATEKGQSIISLIPQSWRIPPLLTTVEQRDVTGPYIRQYLSPLEIEITESSAVDIVAKTSTGQWKARDVAVAFCHRAALAHQLVNCLHEIFFEDALEDAEILDEYYEKNGKPVGPLHGLPVSLKDQFHVRGVETTMGYVGWIGTFEGKKDTGKEKVFESELVRELRELGAVLYVKTSVPHTLMCGETMNNIINYTHNPTNRNLAAGGSSGGEGALQALRGSPLGFGTDIGGSIRIPAAFNGLYGIRPSGGRLPYQGMANSMDGQNSILSVVGPLSSTLDGVKLGLKSVLSREPWLFDPLVVEMPWREEMEKLGEEKLVFGVMSEDDVVGCHPPVERAIDIVAQTARKLGHEVIEWKPPSHGLGLEIALKTWFFDGGSDVHSAFKLSDEPMSNQINNTYGALRPERTASQIAEVNVQKREYQKEYMDYWNSTAKLTASGRPVDAVICAVAPYAAAKVGRYDYYGMSIWVNLLDYTASVFPVTKVGKNIDIIKEGYSPLSELDKKVQETYDPEIFDGAHVSVQLVGRRFQEEKVLAMTEMLSDALKKDD